MRALLAFSVRRTLRFAEERKHLSQFHFTGGPINPRTPTHTYVHASDKQACVHTHTHCLLTQTFANLHRIKEQTL